MSGASWVQNKIELFEGELIVFTEGRKSQDAQSPTGAPTSSMGPHARAKDYGGACIRRVYYTGLLTLQKQGLMPVVS